jgi:hypothetical protein
MTIKASIKSGKGDPRGLRTPFYDERLWYHDDLKAVHEGISLLINEISRDMLDVSKQMEAADFAPN